MNSTSIINIVSTPSFFPISQNNKNESKNIIKNFELVLEDKEYILIVSLIKDDKGKENKSNEKNFYFQLKEKNPEDINKTIYYEQTKDLKELIQLFPISNEKNINQEEYILKQIENYYSKNYICLLKNKDCIDIIFNFKIESSEGIFQKKLELNRKEIENSKEILFNLLNKKIYNLYKELENLKKDYTIKLKSRDEEIIQLNSKIKQLEKQINNQIKTKEIELNKKIDEKEIEINNIKKDIIDIKEKYLNQINNENNELPPPFICKIHPSSIDKMLKLNNQIDAKVGINDLFEVYHLHNDENTVYIATKKKSEDSTDISKIFILQINTLEDICPIIKLEGHDKRITFIKYFFLINEIKRIIY